MNEQSFHFPTSETEMPVKVEVNNKTIVLTEDKPVTDLQIEISEAHKTLTVHIPSEVVEEIVQKWLETPNVGKGTSLQQYGITFV